MLFVHAFHMCVLSLCMPFFPLYKCVDNVSVNCMKRLFVVVAAFVEVVVWHFFVCLFVCFFLSKCAVANRKSI